MCDGNMLSRAPEFKIELVFFTWRVVAAEFLILYHSNLVNNNT